MPTLHQSIADDLARCRAACAATLDPKVAEAWIGVELCLAISLRVAKLEDVFAPIAKRTTVEKSHRLALTSKVDSGSRRKR